MTEVKVRLKHLPILNLNGTSYEELVRQQQNVIEKLSLAIAAMNEAMPHGRDYQLNPNPTDCHLDQAEHVQRMLELTVMRDIHSARLENLVEQNDRYERMKFRPQ
jgi:hypothetical protein